MNIPYQPPSSSSPLDGLSVDQVNQQAQAMLQASAAGYGTAINPQLATEALLTQSAGPVTYAAALGDPSLQGVISSQPIGDSQFVSAGIPPPTALYNDPFQFDPNSYKQYVQGMKQNKLNNSFESMGEAPMANSGWINSILQGDPSTIKKWQQFLSGRGYGGLDDNGNPKKLAVDGYNTPDFQNALKQWSLAYFLPQALFSRDPQEQTLASQFLSTSFGYDVNAIASTMNYNPEQRTKVIDAWLQAQGPDGNNIDRLNAFADHFGSAALPQQLNDLRGDGMFNSIGHFLGHIPGVGNLLGTTPDQLDAKLTPAEKEAMAPALQNAHNNSGWLGFVGDVLSAPSKALVTVGLYIGDATKGKVDNPFDMLNAGSKLRTGADAFVSNPMAEIFGQQFEKDHPWLATIGNVVANVADDPFTWTPFIGQVGLAEKLGEGAVDATGKVLTGDAAKAIGKSRMTTVEKATGGLVSHRVGSLRPTGPLSLPTAVIRGLKNPSLQGVLDRSLNPIGSSQQDFVKLLSNQKMTHNLARKMLGDTDEESTQNIDKLLELAKQPDKSQEVLAMLRDPRNGWADHIIDGRFLANRHQYAKVIKAYDRIADPGKARHIFHGMQMMDSSHLVNGASAVDAVDAASHAAMAAGVDFDKIQQFEDQFWKTSKNDWSRGNLYRGFMDEVKKSLDTKFGDVGADGVKSGGVQKLLAHREKIFGSSQSKEANEIYGIPHTPGSKATETSTKQSLPLFKSDLPDGRTAAEMNDHVATLARYKDMVTLDWRNNVTAAARAIQPDGVLEEDAYRRAIAENPQLKAKMLTYQNVMEEFSKKIEDLRGMTQASTTVEATPMMTSQFYQWYHLPFTASEIMAYANPATRAMEYMQHKSGMDTVMKMWKALVLAKPSTLMHVIAGDETSRFHANFIMNDPATWLHYMKYQAMVHGKDIMSPENIAKLTDDPALLNELLKGLPADVQGNIVAVIHAGLKNFNPIDSGEEGYGEALTNAVQNHYSTQQYVKEWQKAVDEAVASGKDWKKAGRKAIKDFFKGHHEEAHALRESGGVVKTSGPEFENLVQTKISDIEGFTHYDPSVEDQQHVYNWIKNGNVDANKLDELIANHAPVADDYVLPMIQTRGPVLHTGRAGLMDALDAYHEWAQERVMRARGRGYLFQLMSEHKKIKKFYTNPDGTNVFGEGKAADEKMARMAQHRASNWVKLNTYQGGRSAVGSRLRSVAPFWGATANADHFWLRQMMEHPEITVPLMQFEEAKSQAEIQKGSFGITIPQTGYLLSKLGFASGDNITFDPLSALFLTREGLGGFMPGMGPVFNFIAGGLPPGIQDTMSQVPGLQYVSQGAPMLPWAEEVASGAMQVTGAFGGQGIEAPIIGRQSGYYSKHIDEKLQQLEALWEQGGRKGPAPTIKDAEVDYGKQRFGQGVAGFVSPMQMTATEDVKDAIYQAEQTWDPNMPAAQKEQFYQQNAKVADFFKYLDPATPDKPTGNDPESKQDILARSPWVLAYTAGTGTATIPNKATLTDTQAQYKLDVEQGNIRTLTPTEYITKMRNQEESTQAWNQYNRLQATYQEFLQASGVASTSPQAVAWKKLNYDAPLKELMNEYRNWGNTFVKQTSTSTAGMQFASAPLYSVSTFDVLPQNPALETKATTLWRATLIRRDQAVSALQQVIAAGGPQIEKDMIMNGLAQQIDALAAQDPTFAAQISRYRYSTLNDLLTYQATEATNLQQGLPQ